MSNPVVLLLARILLSFMFIASGLQKFGNIAGTAGYVGSVGLPVPVLLAWGAAIFETVAGLAVLAGFMTAPASLLLAAFCVVSGILFHANFADQMQTIMFMKNMTIAGGFLVLASAGAGSLSVDARRA